MIRETAHHYVLHPTIIWDITTHCNFRCVYCYSDHMPDRHIRLSDRMPVADAAKAFADTLPGWAIVFIGGEPFLYQDFVDLCQAVSAINPVGIYTNLSLTEQIHRFMDTVEPQYVNFVNCAIHPMERSRIDPQFHKFVRDFHLLREAGFHVVATYVVHPMLLPRVTEDVQRLEETGIPVHLKVFRGVFEGLSYPEFYDPEALALIASKEPPMIRGRQVRSEITGEAGACYAGMHLLDMDVEGNVYRCLTDRSLQRDCLGNIFLGTLRRHTQPQVCRNEVCISARQGMGFSLSETRDLSTEENERGLL